MCQENNAKNLSFLENEFPRQDLDLWWQKINAELGDKRVLDDITWHIEEDVSVSPMPPKFESRSAQACFSRQTWSIVENWSRPPSEFEWKELINHGVDEIGISISAADAFVVPKESDLDISVIGTRAVLESLLPHQSICFAQIQSVDKQDLMGHLAPSWLPWRTARSIEDGAPTERLESILTQLVLHLKNEPVGPPEFANRYRVHFEITKNYLTEIAALRALRILLYNLWKAFGLDLKECPKIYAQIDYDQGLDDNTNLIIQTSKAVSAVLGGADAVSIDSQSSENNSRYRRLCRNIHHILMHESSLHHRIDPLEGSHLIEYLTSQFALKSWERLKGVDL